MQPDIWRHGRKPSAVERPSPPLPAPLCNGTRGPGTETGRFMAPHGLAVDSRGDIYVGEVSDTNWPTSFPEIPPPKFVRSLLKLEKVT